jgi:RNA-binding protein YhbY
MEMARSSPCRFIIMEKFQLTLQSKPHVLLGKNGVTPKVLEHMNAQLKQHLILKVKIHTDTAKDKGRDVIIEEIMRGLHVYVLDVRGFTFIISKKKVNGVHLPKKFLEIYSNLPSKPKKWRSRTVLVQTKKPEPTPSESGSDFSSESEPEFIDYDDENLVARIDRQSDDIYGAVKAPRSVPKPKVKRSPRLDNKKPKKFVRKTAKKALRKKKKASAESTPNSETDTPSRKQHSYSGKRRKGPSRPARKKSRK